MPEKEPPPGSERARPRLPRMSDLVDITDEMIQFADTYQQVWEQEAKATLALGEFLQARSQSLARQVELMRMGNDAFRRYNQWSEAIFGIRPDTLMRGITDTFDRFRNPERDRERP